MLGCRYSSLDSSAPSIMPPRVRVPCFLSIYIVQIVYLSFELECEKNENKQKEAGIGPFFKKGTMHILYNIPITASRFCAKVTCYVSSNSTWIEKFEVKILDGISYVT